MSKDEHRGAPCNYCGEYMLETDGCRLCLYELPDGTKVEPVRYGDPREDAGIDPEILLLVRGARGAQGKAGHRCNDCGAKTGQFHHPGCDVERCPVCGHQAIGCECLTEAKIYARH